MIKKDTDQWAINQVHQSMNLSFFSVNKPSLKLLSGKIKVWVGIYTKMCTKQLFRHYITFVVQFYCNKFSLENTSLALAVSIKMTVLL